VTTLLIGLDGATFTVLDRLMQQGVMPFMRQAIERGTRCELMSPPNHITPSSWASLMTGRSPGNHGVFDFVQPIETDRGIYVKFVDGRDLQAETIWSIASRQGCKVTCLNFPLTYPIRDVHGYVVPGFISRRTIRSACFPSDLWSELTQIPEFNPREIGWDLNTERKAIQVVPDEELEELIEFHIRREQRWLTLWSYLNERHPCEFSAVLFDGIDKLQHLAWPFIDEDCFPARPSPLDLRVRARCLDYFRELDRVLAAVVEQVGDDTRIFMVSDHGLGPTQDIFYVNVWLHEHGFLEWGNVEQVPEGDEEIAAQRMKTQHGLLDWAHTIAYAVSPSSNGVYIRVQAAPGDPGIPADRYADVRDEIARGLLSFVDPESGQSVVRRAMTREEIYAGTHMGMAPDLTLALRDQGFISVLNGSSVLSRRARAKGMHRPEGIFVALGPGIRRDHRANMLNMVDVSSALLYSLGLEIPVDLEGQFPVDMFDPSLMEVAPPRSGARTRTAQRDGRTAVSAFSAQEEAALAAHLRRLGYIE
jgi:predicted AlkP superfamily phosphohydrolase/phosphomutase